MGKSTIASLLLRFYDIDSGEILIDGKSIYEFDLENLAYEYRTSRCNFIWRNYKNIAYGNLMLQTKK
jgi:ABC-type transport system involved in Fe-S cluster assembly fused permease/ATPase subunit